MDIKMHLLENLNVFLRLFNSIMGKNEVFDFVHQVYQIEQAIPRKVQIKCI